MDEALLTMMMQLAVDESALSKSEDGHIHPKVGSVLIDEYGQIISKAHRGERGNGDHAEYIAITKAHEASFTGFKTATIFTTLEPCTHRGHDKTPCAERIVQAGIERVFIGALDPNPLIQTHGETYLRDRLPIVERFPGELERKIREINREFWELYRKSHLPSTSLYMAVRVGDRILNKLNIARVDIDYLPNDSEYSLNDLIAYVYGKGNFGRDRAKLTEFLREARSDAFDQKYADYTYENDARRIEERWKKEFVGIMKRFKIYDYPKRKILNVGFGNGLEGVDLFEACRSFTAVDTGPASLRRAQSRFPRATFKHDAAELLQTIEDESQDIYVSLRTYQSSLFDISESVRQAYRVLVPGGVLVISIANAYLEENALIRGLMPHGSKIVDGERAYKLIDHIRHSLGRLRFNEIGVHSGKAEEYIFGKKRY